MRYFWLALTAAAVTWYIFVTAYVAFKGVTDIKVMLRRLSGRHHPSDDSDEAVTKNEH